MKYSRCCLYWIVLSFLLTACQVQDSYSGKIILNGTQELASGKSLDGDVFLLGGTFVQQPGSTIGGSVQIIDGQAHIGGEVRGNMTLLGGELTVLAGSVLRGDLTAPGGTLTVSPAARIEGELTSSRAADKAGVPPILLSSTAGRFIHLLLEIPLLALVGYLAARFYPPQIHVIQEALVRHPFACTALGLLAMVAGLSLAILMAYTILLLPVSALLLVLMLFATTFGAVPVAAGLGKWTMRHIQSSPTSTTTAAILGMLLLAVMAEILRYLPWIGNLLVITLLLTAFGASLLTRFGGQAVS